jgi:holo-[acyl-carrier protein] synthase
MSPVHPSDGHKLGHDLVFVPRIAKALVRYGESFACRVLTPAERHHWQQLTTPHRQAEWLAGRIAGKEAIAKALGVGINGLGWAQGISWQDVSLMPQNNAPPMVVWVKKPAVHLNWQVSLSHDGDYVSAVVLGH